MNIDIVSKIFLTFNLERSSYVAYSVRIANNIFNYFRILYLSGGDFESDFRENECETCLNVEESCIQARGDDCNFSIPPTWNISQVSFPLRLEIYEDRYFVQLESRLV